MIFQAGAYTVVYTGSTNSSQVGRTLIGPGLIGRRPAGTRLGNLFVPAPSPAPNLKQDERFSMAANSTVMYSGLDPCAKSSSKVLAPPGGKSSIGFGPEEDLAPAAPAEPNQGPRSSTNVTYAGFIYSQA